jgi:hypothetical protein
LERLRRQHRIARSLPPRRAQPPRLNVLEPGRRRAGRRVAPVLLTIALVIAAIVLVVLV